MAVLSCSPFNQKGLGRMLGACARSVKSQSLLNCAQLPFSGGKNRWHSGSRRLNNRLNSLLSPLNLCGNFHIIVSGARIVRRGLLLQFLMTLPGNRSVNDSYKINDSCANSKFDNGREGACINNFWFPNHCPRRTCRLSMADPLSGVISHNFHLPWGRLEFWVWGISSIN